MSPIKSLLALVFLVASFLAPAVASAQDEISCDDFTNREAALIVADSDRDFEDMLTEDDEICPDLPSAGSSVSSPLFLGLDESDFDAEEMDDSGDDEFWSGITYEGSNGISTVGVYWMNDVAAHIILFLDEPAEFEVAIQLAASAVPADTDYDDEYEIIDGDAVFLAAESETLESLFERDDYDDLDVGGRPGDFRIILVPSADDDELFQVVSIGIGEGDEWDPDLVDTGTSSNSDDDDDTNTDDDDDTNTNDDDTNTDDDDDTGDSDDASTYLTTVREGKDQIFTEITRFTELLMNSANWTTADQAEFLGILDTWSTLEDTVSDLDAPDGMEDVQEAYELLASELGSVATNINAFLSSGGTDTQAFTDATTDLQEAVAALTTLETLLIAAGA